jgi:UDP-glucose 4-epimerase
MSILVTGGLGFIGSNVYASLMKTYPEKQIVIIDNYSNSTPLVMEKINTVTSKHVTFYNSDINNHETMDKIFKIYSFKTVMHFAGFKSVNDSIHHPLEYYSNNISNLVTLLQIMKKHNCFNLIFSSSATVYGNQESPLCETMGIGKNISNPYGNTKYISEIILRDTCNSDCRWNIISLRYFNPVGSDSSRLLCDNPKDTPSNLMPFIVRVGLQQIMKDESTPQYNILCIHGNDYSTVDGTCMRDFIHVSDIASGHMSAYGKMGALTGYNYFNLGTGCPTSVKQLVDTFERVNNVSIPYKFCERRKGDEPMVFCDASKAWRLLEWKAEKTIEDMCRDSWTI